MAARAPVPAQHRLLVLYGTQTGTAEDVATCLVRQSRCRGFRPVMQTMDQYDRIQLPSEQLVFFVASTTGDAEAPETMKQFWRFLLRRSLPRGVLSGVKFAVFGLGDSSYPKFNAVARRLEVRLKWLGAKEIFPIGLGDDQSDLGVHGDFDNWSIQLWKQVLTLYPIPAGCVIDDAPKLVQPVQVRPCRTPNQPESVDCSSFYSRPSQDCYVCSQNSLHPIQATLTANRRVTGKSWKQDVRHLEFELPNDAPHYQAGDVAVIWPQNMFKQASVNELLKCLGYANQWLIAEGFPSPCSTQDLFKKYLDVHGIPKRFFFEQLSFFVKPKDPCNPEAKEKAEEQKEKLLELSRVEGADLYQSYIVKARRTYIEVLLDFSCARPPLPYLIRLIPKLKPRHFSIASSQIYHEKRLQLIVALVRYKTRFGREKEGVCSAWLQQLRVGTVVPLWLRRGTIRLTEWWRPIICIGPGTGIAPMRSLIYRRGRLHSKWQAGQGDGPTESKMLGSCRLFFGCRHESQDFFYRSEWSAAIKEKFLDSLHVAFSRDNNCLTLGMKTSKPHPVTPSKKIYVQHLLLQNAKLVWDGLKPEAGGYCYVAGSAQTQMPSDVRNALLKIFETEGGLSKEAAKKYMRVLEHQRRFQCEAWS